MPIYQPHEAHGGRRSARSAEAMVRAQTRDSDRRNKERARKGSALDRAANFVGRLLDGSSAKGKRGK